MDKLLGTLGLLVLGLPYVLMLFWIPVCIALAVWVARKKINKDWKVKTVGGFSVFLLALFLPFGDEIAGRIYFNYLCETEVGTKVYQTIELPAENWDADGKPKFMNFRGILDTKILGDRFEWKQHTTPVVNFIIQIDQKKWVIHDNQSNKDLGGKVSFARYYGWLNTFSPAPNVSESCLNYWAGKYGRDRYIEKEASINRDLMDQIFPSPEPNNRR